MLHRRRFLQSASGILLAGMGGLINSLRATDDFDLSAGDLTDEDFVVLYDTNAQALYFDGGLGPYTGVIKVDYILKNEPITLNFWHGHGGTIHQFTLTPEHYAQLKSLKRTYLVTTSVADHTHRLFIDPVDPRWRVPGAVGVKVPREPKPKVFEPLANSFVL